MSTHAERLSADLNALIEYTASRRAGEPDGDDPDAQDKRSGEAVALAEMIQAARTNLMRAQESASAYWTVEQCNRWRRSWMDEVIIPAYGVNIPEREYYLASRSTPDIDGQLTDLAHLRSMFTRAMGSDKIADIKHCFRLIISAEKMLEKTCLAADVYMSMDASKKSVDEWYHWIMDRDDIRAVRAAHENDPAFSERVLDITDEYMARRGVSRC